MRHRWSRKAHAVAPLIAFGAVWPAHALDGGVGWHEHNPDVHDGRERFFRSGFNANQEERACRST